VTTWYLPVGFPDVKICIFQKRLLIQLTIFSNNLNWDKFMMNYAIKLFRISVRGLVISFVSSKFQLLILAVLVFRFHCSVRVEPRSDLLCFKFKLFKVHNIIS